MSAYRPAARERVLLTVEATFREGVGASRAVYAVANGGTLEAYLFPASPAILDVQPIPRTLPTEWGSLILARVGGGQGCPVLLTLGSHDEESAWFIAGAQPFQAAPVEDILPGWVQIDPATLREIEVKP